MTDKKEIAPNKKADVKGGLLRFLWDRENKTVMARTGASWAKIGLFYVLFFSGLGFFFWANMEIFFLTMDKVVPKYFGLGSQTLDNPGLSYRPMPNFDSSLIKFAQGRPSSYAPYLNHLDAFLHEFREVNQTATNVIDCSTLGPNDKRPAHKVCFFNADTMETASTKECGRVGGYGFYAGEPCIALKMNRLYDYVPDPYSSKEELLKDQDQTKPLPRFISFQPNASVGVGCDGDNQVDRENLQAIQFFPSTGFNKHFYPYLNQENYVSPLVFIKFTSFTKRVAIMVECKLYARNIANEGGNHMHGTVNFVLVVD